MSMRVLLVDDKDYELQSLKLLLLGEGYDVEGFTDPLQAIGYLERERVDLIVTDLQMRDVGIQLSEAAKDLYPDVEVIVVTAFGTIETAVEADETRRLSLYRQVSTARGRTLAHPGATEKTNGPEVLCPGIGGGSFP